MPPKKTRMSVLSCQRMPGVQRVLGALVAVCLLVGIAADAQAEASFDQLVRRLEQGEDFRVRTQAALALGASRDKRALRPLCRGLNDGSATVRAAAAAAMGKLQLGGAECLKKRLKEETSGAVKASIEKALKDVSGGGEPPEPAITADTKVYLAIDKVAGESGRKETDALVRSAITRSVSSLSGYIVAPPNETLDQAKRRLSKHKHVRAFLLSPRVEPPSYAGGNLTIRMEVAIFSYPARALKGSIPIKLTQQGVASGDTQSENELLQMAAERAVQKFADNMDRID